MFSIIGGRIRCEMGKSGYECYRQTALLHSPHVGVQYHCTLERTFYKEQRAVLTSKWLCGLFSKEWAAFGSLPAADGRDRESGTDNWR